MNYFLQKLFSGKYTDIDSSRVSCLRLSFSEDLIYVMTYVKIKIPKSMLFPNAIKSLTNNTELINITHKYGHGILYTILEELDTEYALLQLNQREETGGVVFPEEYKERERVTALKDIFTRFLKIFSLKKRKKKFLLYLWGFFLLSKD